MSGCGCEIEIKNNGERRTLIILLVINGVIFFAEIIVDIISDSTALVADSLDRRQTRETNKGLDKRH